MEEAPEIGRRHGRRRARYVGVYSGRINDQSDLGFVWKADAVAELVAIL